MPLVGGLSERIAKLLSEGYKYDQAVAIAFSSMKKRKKPKPQPKRSPKLPKRGQRINKNKRK